MRRFLLLVAISFSPLVMAGEFTLSSGDLSPDAPVPMRHVYDGYGCQGENISPALSWSGAPEGTKSFALTARDPDAPTDGGWWHWIVYDLPATSDSLRRGASAQALPQGAAQATNDFGQRAWGGPCPPKGDEPHRYRFKVYALDTSELEIPEDATPAMADARIQAHALDKATLTIRYGR
ncbi:YbhB/YbcL family Raf kinase inhibitor-like protein [Arhodomonas sp. AD133]|uniref:YbhB/YbcL family Raf kinase inhibitor-like protein n=1 Tax=Arhodomonas sp. AD133 TaxID=3415009 RepID=UPI003EBEBF0C